MQSSIFDLLYEQYKIKKPIRLIELDNLEIIVTDNGDIFTTNKNKIRSNGRLDNRKGKKLKPATDKDGYLRITLTNYGKRKSYFVHRLVARTFLDNYDDKLQVNHKNGIKNDNRIENLEMCTLQENIKHSIKTGLKPKLLRNKNGIIKSRKEVN